MTTSSMSNIPDDWLIVDQLVPDYIRRAQVRPNTTPIRTNKPTHIRAYEHLCIQNHTYIRAYEHICIHTHTYMGVDREALLKAHVIDIPS